VQLCVFGCINNAMNMCNGSEMMSELLLNYWSGVLLIPNTECACVSQNAHARGHLCVTMFLT